MADTYGPTSSKRGLVIGIVVALVVIGAIVAIVLVSGGGSGGGSGVGGYALVAIPADRARAALERRARSRTPG